MRDRGRNGCRSHFLNEGTNNECGIVSAVTDKLVLQLQSSGLQRVTQQSASLLSTRPKLAKGLEV
jgi:hypothetical protein